MLFAMIARTVDGPVVLHIADAHGAYDPEFFMTCARRAAHVAHDLSTVVEVTDGDLVAAIDTAMAGMAGVTAAFARDIDAARVAR